jgi:pyruvate dehydrogenase E2 component (dihydrolipoamide acetyltransferase)
MPSLGADMEKGTVVEWLKKPGDRIVRGEVLAVVETQKGAFEIEVFEDGVLGEILVPISTEAPVGAVLARIDSAGAAPKPTVMTLPPMTAPIKPTLPLKPTLPRREVPTRPTASQPAAGRLRISPAAARRATELGVDVRTLSGSGPQGAIAIADVDAAATKAPPTTPRRGFDPAAMRQAIASAMARSKREIPHYYLSLPIDLGRSMEWLTAENQLRDVERRLLPGALLLRAVALALREVPQLNGFWIDGAPKLSRPIHIGWAISLRGGGLLAPAIRDADQLTLDQTMTALRDLVTRARTARIRGSEMMDPTITVTSLGERGADSVLGVIYPPQLAIVGFGGPRTTALLIEGEIRPRPVVQATLAADHRASDGAVGSRLLAAIEQHLQKPDTL